MTKIISIALALHVIGLRGAYADDCVIEDAKPEYAPKTAGIQRYKRVRADAHDIVETFELPDGTGVRIEQSGCEHLERSVTFTLPVSKAQNAKSGVKYWLARANVLLAHLPEPNGVGLMLFSELYQLSPQLAKQKLSADHGLEAEENDNTLSVTLKETGAKIELTAALDTAV